MRIVISAWVGAPFSMAFINEQTLQFLQVLEGELSGVTRFRDEEHDHAIDLLQAAVMGLTEGYACHE